MFFILTIFLLVIALIAGVIVSAIMATLAECSFFSERMTYAVFIICLIPSSFFAYVGLNHSLFSGEEPSVIYSTEAGEYIFAPEGVGSVYVVSFDKTENSVEYNEYSMKNVSVSLDVHGDASPHVEEVENHVKLGNFIIYPQQSEYIIHLPAGSENYTSKEDPAKVFKDFEYDFDKEFVVKNRSTSKDG